MGTISYIKKKLLTWAQTSIYLYTNEMEECAVESIEANCTHLHSPPFMLYYALSSLYSTTHLLLHAQLCTLFIELNYIPSLSHSSMHFLFHARLYLLLHSQVHTSLSTVNCVPSHSCSIANFLLCAQLCTSFSSMCSIVYYLLCAQLHASFPSAQTHASS